MVLHINQTEYQKNTFKNTNTIKPPMSTPQYLIDFINIYGSITSLIVSIILGGLSIWLSFVFFRSAKASEGETTKILEGIKHNVTTLNTINNDLLSKALLHLASSNSQMIDIIGHYNQNIKSASASSSDDTGFTQPTNEKNVRHSILATIKFLTAISGNALSIHIFDELKRSYEFSAILYELMRMASEGIISWEGAPKAPEAMSSITIVNNENIQT